MVVGICRVELSVPNSFSLKDKRRVLKSTIKRARNKFNISISEIDSNENWQRAILGISSLSNNSHYTNKILNGVINYLEKERDLIIINYSIELF